MIVRRILNTLKWAIKNKKVSNKSLVWIIADFYKLRKKNKINWIEYSNFKLHSANDDFKNTFLSYSKAEEYWELLNPRKHAVLARDKFISHALLSKIGVSTAQLYFAYDKESERSNTTVVDKIRLLNIKSFVAKPAADSAHGKGVGVYDINDIVEFGGTKMTMDEILSCGKMVLFESIIKQTEQIARINSSSVNTIRMMTALYPNSKVKMIAAFIKIGRAGSCVDNAGSGGNVDCAVNIETGELYNALQFNSWEDVFPIDKHPDSGVKLNGLIIDNWERIKETVMGWQAKISHLKTIGWDVAVTESGPVIVEINNWWDTTGQLFIGKGWHKEVKECYDAWANYYKKN